MRRALLFVLLAGCAGQAPALTGEVGPPSSGWTSPVSHAICAPDDVAARLHFASVSHLTWMSPTERIALARADLGQTRRADEQLLDRMGLDASLRILAPMALSAAGDAELAAQLRAAPVVRERADLEPALVTVERARRQASDPRSARLLATLEEELRDTLAGESTSTDRCEQDAAAVTAEAAVAVAALHAGAPRDRVVEESLALLDRMAAVARAEG